jgi:uncharacterized membrane protein
MPDATADGLSGFNRRQRSTSGFRLAVALAMGLLAGAAGGARLGWALLPLIGWVVAALVFLLWTWSAVWPLDGPASERLSQREDPSTAVADVLLLATSVAAMLAVALVIFRASHSGSGGAGRLSLGVAAVVCAWGVVHTVFTLAYARQYYLGAAGGIAFNQKAAPAYRDFAYLAFTVGMTFQVSDTNIEEPVMRSLVLRHALVSYLFGAVILAVTINLLAGLSK